MTQASVTSTTDLGSGSQPQLPVAPSFSALAELRWLFLACSSLRPGCLLGTLPIMLRAGGGCSAGCRPSPQPQPRAPPCPAPRASCRPLHPGTDASRPDSGTMVMAEGTAVLRRNRPGTKAQVSSPWLSCQGVRGAEPSLSCWRYSVQERPARAGGGRGRGGWPALPEPRPLRQPSRRCPPWRPARRRTLVCPPRPGADACRCCCTAVSGS